MASLLYIRSLSILFVLVASAHLTLASNNVTLAWDPSITSDVAGYRVLYGTTSGQFTGSIDVGSATGAVVPDLAQGSTYFLVVTAYNSARLESLPSAEILFVVPESPPSPSPTPAPNSTPLPSPVPTPPAGVTLSVSTVRMNPGETVSVTVTGGPADALDLVNVFPVGSEFALDGFFLNGTKTPPATGVSTAVLQFVIRASGEFVFRFYSRGNVMATSQNVIVGNFTPAPTPTPQPSASPTPAATPSATPSPTSTPTSTPVATPAPSATPIPTPTPTPTPAFARMLNVSTRANVQTGDNVLIGGLIISGDVPKRVVMRAVGPSLGAAGVSGALANPTLALYNSKGILMASNDNWRTNAASIQATGLSPTNDLEAAIVADLTPGAYTAVLSGAGGTTGVGLFELYDLTQAAGRVANISTRGKVEAGDKVMIGGFIIGGTQPGDVVVRAIGPSLEKAGITDALPDPALELYNGNGSLIFRNDNWRAEQQAQISATSLAPTDDRESAVRATLAPGNYTAVVRSARANSTGVAMVEVYNLAK